MKADRGGFVIGVKEALDTWGNLHPATPPLAPPPPSLAAPLWSPPTPDAPDSRKQKQANKL